ncbi:hypothetical protein C8R46DRAFT_1038829 [Mycena filopes]|nr:hypothetical protein C8R46DRAFT_1038829 [Mycena filopes]
MDARAPPFSLLEFGDLVSAALASPDIPPLASAIPVPQATTTPTAPTTRTRSLFSRVKHALTLVSLRSPHSTTNPRRGASAPAVPDTHRRTRSPTYRIPELQRLSAFSAFDAAPLTAKADAFEPALPLVMQYERVYGQSVPLLPSYSAYSSPSASSAYCDSSPPTSTSSCTSSGSSYPPTPLTLSSVSEDPSESRWSLSSCADSDVNDVFLNVQHLKQVPTPTPTLRRRTRLSLGLGLRFHLGRGLPPAKPVPACPLPPLPFPHSHPPSSDAFSQAFSDTSSTFSPSPTSRHTFTAPTPTPTAHAEQPASRSLRSVQSLHSFRVVPLHDEETRSLTTRARPSARSGRRAPVPSLLDAFPVPPSSLPSSPFKPPLSRVESFSDRRRVVDLQEEEAEHSMTRARPHSPFPFTRPIPTTIPIAIPGAYPPSPPRFSAFGDDDDFDAQDDVSHEEEGAEGEDGDVFHSACSEAL